MTDTSAEALQTMVYARGFLLTKDRPVGVPKHWATRSFAGWSFIHDPVTPVAVRGDTLIFGHAVDLETGTANTELIAADFESAGDDAQRIIDRMAGRFLVLRYNEGKILIQQDAVGLRALYYTEGQHPFVAGSHQHLVARQIDAPHNDFAGSYMRDNGTETDPGRATSHMGVIRQTPNTELDSTTGQLRRIFPLTPIEPCSVEEAANSVIEAARTQLDAHVGRPLAASLTGGFDSRVTLALVRHVKDHVNFFTYNLSYREPNEGNKYDKETALQLAERFSLSHTMLDIKQVVDDEVFNAAMMKNTTFSHSRSVAKAYSDNLPGYALHLRSNAFEIARGYYRQLGYQHDPVDAAAMRHITSGGKNNNDSAHAAFEKFRADTRFEDATALGYDGLDLFYWEHRMGVWLTPVLHESDIAQDTHILINARTILAKLLGVPLQDRMQGSVFKTIIFKQWPELAEIPVNGKILQPS